MTIATPGPGEPEVVFQHAVEGLYLVGLRNKVTPALANRLKRLGMDLGKLDPAYPRHIWNESIRITTEMLWPGEPPERAYHALGRQLLQGYVQTVIGKAIAAVLRVIGPRKALERMTRNFRSGGNFNVCRTTEVAPGEVLFWMNEPELHPSYLAGILEGALELAGAKGVNIQVESRDSEGCSYRIRWS